MTNSEFRGVLKRLSHILNKQSLLDCERVQDAKTIVYATMEQVDADDKRRSADDG